jgi:murein DD-endopeptidase MepM/ murein hydrolase activator NlpD
MKFGVTKTAGSEARSADNYCLSWLVLAVLLVSSAGDTQALYKYRGENGEWIFTDRAPPEDQPAAEIRKLPQGSGQPRVTVTHEVVDGLVRFNAQNEFYAPVELQLSLEGVASVGGPDKNAINQSGINQNGLNNSGPWRWTLPARGSTELLRIDLSASISESDIRYQYRWLPGDPTARHRPARAYRAPFAVAREHRISQAYPIAVTHSTPDSRHAVDIAMPVGTDIYAARGGRVVEVASSNYRGGLDTSREGAQANLVRILHDDGTFAIYAHLNLNSVRVRPGDQVVRGEYIADSGNTGFSSGPHLHFVVVRNSGLAVESVPVVFEGRNADQITPRAGANLSAY